MSAHILLMGLALLLFIASAVFGLAQIAVLVQVLLHGHIRFGWFLFRLFFYIALPLTLALGCGVYFLNGLN